MAIIGPRRNKESIRNGAHGVGYIKNEMNETPATVKQGAAGTRRDSSEGVFRNAVSIDETRLSICGTESCIRIKMLPVRLLTQCFAVGRMVSLH
jgi:hypothetical protein